jgi:hypothetical protein
VSALGVTDTVQMVTGINEWAGRFYKKPETAREGFMKVAIAYYSQHHGNTKKTFGCRKKTWGYKTDQCG